jgi:hypothetical protein
MNRIVDEDLLATVRELPCMACGRTPAGHAHHVKTRGSGGHDLASNCMPLCPTHHAHIHQSGTAAMARWYPVIHNWLVEAGWTYDPFFDRWRLP